MTKAQVVKQDVNKIVDATPQALAPMKIGGNDKIINALLHFTIFITGQLKCDHQGCLLVNSLELLSQSIKWTKSINKCSKVLHSFYETQILNFKNYISQTFKFQTENRPIKIKKLILNWF